MRLFIILFFLIPFAGLSQNSCDPLTIQKYFVRAKGSEPVVKQTKNVLTLSLVGDFNDSCRLFINDSLVIARFVRTNPLLGHSGQSFSINKRNHKNGPVLKMLLVSKNICFTEKLRFNYPVLELRLFENKWLLTYTNRVAQLE